MRLAESLSAGFGVSPPPIPLLYLRNHFGSAFCEPFRAALRKALDTTFSNSFDAALRALSILQRFQKPLSDPHCREHNDPQHLCDRECDDRGP